LSEIAKEDRVFRNDIEYFVKSVARHIILLFSAFRNKVEKLSKARKELMFDKFIDIVLQKQGWLEFDFAKDVIVESEDTYEGD